MSAIDITKPVAGSPTTQSVRDNFATAATEIDAATALAAAKLSDAPNDGSAYGRLSAAWAQVLPIAGGIMQGPLVQHANPIQPLETATKQYVDALATAVGVNVAHNVRLNIAQRGAGPFVTFGNYTLDRWVLMGATDTVSIAQIALTDADRASIGDESAVNALQATFTGAPAGNCGSAHYVENVRRLGGKQVTVSFWARASGGTPRLGIAWQQVFGTGGSPSAAVNGNVAITAALGTGWVRYQGTVTLPSTAGKTLGTNANSYTEFRVFYSNGANVAMGGAIGQQNGTVAIWGVKIEPGAAATNLQPIDPTTELAECQRYYTVLSQLAIFLPNFTAVGQAMVISITYPVTMRAPPATSAATIVYSNMTALAANGSPTQVSARFQAASLAAGQGSTTFDILCVADL